MAPNCRVYRQIDQPRTDGGKFEVKWRKDRARDATADIAEVPLTGGRTTQGVVLVDDTVRRPRNDNRDFVERLLRHLEAVRFDGAPRYLGVDARDRDVLSHISGQVPRDLQFWESETLVAAARLIRKFHDATAASDLVSGNEVVCHNDLSPCNAVFVGGVPRALIDFDAAAPGDRAWDLGYAAWLWLDIGRPDVSAKQQAERLALFLDAYGFAARGAVLLAMRERQFALERACSDPQLQHAADWARRSRNWLDANRATIDGHPFRSDRE